MTKFLDCDLGKLVHCKIARDLNHTISRKQYFLYSLFISRFKITYQVISYPNNKFLDIHI